MQIINLLLMISLCFCMRMYIETIGLNINNETYSEQTNSHKYFKTVKNSSVDKVACRTFASAAHLAAYVGLAPVSRCSGQSIRDEHLSRRENKTLKRALYLSTFATLRESDLQDLLHTQHGPRKTTLLGAYRHDQETLRCPVRYGCATIPLQRYKYNRGQVPVTGYFSLNEVTHTVTEYKSLVQSSHH